MRPNDQPDDSSATSGRPTLRDVAREAGLSVTQTSRALNGHSDVAEATRQRALDAARAVRYSPNLEARRLKNPDSKLHSIGLVLSTASQRFSDPFFGELLTALVDEAATNGYELQLSAPLPDEDPVASYQRLIRSQRVDGFVVLRTANNDERVKHLAREELPFVTFGEPSNTVGHPVVTDSEDCLRPAVDHMVALGHVRIACIAEPLEYALADTRYRSFVTALEANGISMNPDYQAIAGYREDDGFEAAHRLLALPIPPTAIVTFNDLLAIGAMSAARSLGVDVPNRLSVVGFDDIHAARHTSPPLTTLRHPADIVGRSLIQQLLRAIDKSAEISPVYVNPELVVRGSTAAVSP